MAHLISAIFAPPVLAVAMFAAAASTAPEADAWPWAGLAVTIGVLAPIGYVLWLHRRGLVSDLDVQRRAERWRPLLFTLTA